MYSILLLSLALISDGEARRKRPKADKTDNTQQEANQQQDIFAPVYQSLKNGQKNEAIQHLWAITQNPEYQAHHGRAYLQLAAILEDLNMPYNAMLVYSKALQTGTMAFDALLFMVFTF